MKRSFLIVYTAAIALLLVVPSYAEKDARNLTIDQCIELALEHNIGLRSANLSVDISEYDYQAALAPFDPMFSLNLYNSVTRRGGISLESQIAGGSVSKYLAGDFEFKQRLFTGGQWALKYESGRSESESFLTEGSVTAYESKTTFTYTHPVWQGSGKDINTTGLRIAQIGAHQERNRRDNAVRELVLSVKSTFYDVLKAKKAIDVAQLSLEEAETLLEATRVELEAGYLSSYEVMAAESGLASREEALLLAKTDYLNKVDTLKNLTGMSLDENINLSGDLESDLIKIPDFDTLFTLAEKKRPDILQLIDTLELAKIDIKINSDLVKSSLAMVGQVGLQGEDLEFGKAVSGMNNLSWYIGLNYSVPLGGNREATARLKQAKLKLESSELAYNDSINTVKLEVIKALRNLETALERLEVTSKGVKLQEQKLLMEKARFELGLITAGDLLDYEEDLAAARLRQIEAKADYLKALSYLEYVTNNNWENDRT